MNKLNEKRGKNMRLRRYTALIYKDLFICKTAIASSLGLIILFAICIPRDMLASSFYNPVVMVTSYITLLAIVGPIWQEEKNKGMELLLITPCTRRDAVICRYLLLLMINLVNFMIYYGVEFFVTKQIVFMNSEFIETFFIVCLTISLVVPVSFKFKAAVASVIISAIIFVIYEVPTMFIKIKDMKSLPVFLGIILLSILLIMLSAIVSIRIYSKKDL